MCPASPFHVNISNDDPDTRDDLPQAPPPERWSDRVVTFAAMTKPEWTDKQKPRQQDDGHVVSDLIKLFRGDRATLDAKRTHLIDHLMSCRDCQVTLGLLLKSGSQATGLSEAQHQKFEELYTRLVRVMADPHQSQAAALYRSYVADWAATLQRPSAETYRDVNAHLRTCVACDRNVRTQVSATMAERIVAEYRARREQREGEGQPPLPGATPAVAPPARHQSWHEVLHHHAVLSAGMRVKDEYHNFEVEVENWLQGELLLVLWGRDLRHDNQRRALTLLRPEYDRDPAARQSFVEAALDWCYVASHGKPHTAAQLIHLPAFGGAPALLTTYAPHTLRDALTAAHQGKRDVSLAQALGWAMQTTAALVALHGHQRYGAPHPLVHGNLKPANILIGEDDESWLSQGGLHRVWSRLGTQSGSQIGERVHHPARDPQSPADTRLVSPQGSGGIPRIEPALLTLDPRVGSRGVVVGTPGYMAPERWLGVNATVPASDIYALGIVLYEIFAGAPGGPFVPAPHNASAWFRAHQCGPSRTLRSAEAAALTRGPLRHLFGETGSNLKPREREARARQLLNELDLLIHTCLAPLPQDRPTAAEVLDQLNLFADRLGIQRMPNPPADAAHATDPLYIRRLMRSYRHSRTAGDWDARLHTLCAHARQTALPEVWTAIGSALQHQGEEQLALEAYTVAESLASSPHVDIEPDLHAIVSFHRGDTYAQQGKHREAVNEYRRSLHQRQEHVPSMVAMAYTLSKWAAVPGATPEQRLQRLGEAREQAWLAANKEPRDPALRGFAERLESDYATINGRQDRSTG